jgi:hypothetical protein
MAGRSGAELAWRLGISWYQAPVVILVQEPFMVEY